MWLVRNDANFEWKAILYNKGCENIYDEFLSGRDYYLEILGQQLQSMRKIFGKKHTECTEIWQNLFLNDTNSRSP
jgi:hypothetical protein